MRSVLALSLVLSLLGPARADDATGKTIQVKEPLKLGRKLGGGLARDGAELDPKKSYTVKSDDGTFLELDGGFIFKSDARIVADAKPLPKAKAPESDPVAAKGEWFGKNVLPRRDQNTIRMGDWVDGQQVYWTPHNLNNCTVREDKEGFLRLYDMRREGWVAKEDMVTAEDAPAWWDKAVKEDPSSNYAWGMRGNSWLDKGEYDNAIKDYTEAIRLQPDSSAAYNNRGLAWGHKKEYDKAVADYTEAIRLDPKDALAYNNRGLAWHAKKEYDKAVADYTEALRLDPKYAKAYHNRGDAWVAKKEYDKAVADYTEANRLDPKNATAHNNRGDVWNYKKEYDEAVAAYIEALRLDPKYANAYIGRGYARFHKKDYDKAVADYTEALRLDPKSAYAIGNKGRVLVKLKKYDEAAKGFEQALEIDPMDWIYTSYAWFRATCPDAQYRDGKRAVELAKKAIEKTGKNVDWNYLDTLAAAYAEAGDFELAVAEQRKAVEMAQSDKSADAEDRKKAEARLALYRDKKPYRDEEK